MLCIKVEFIYFLVINHFCQVIEKSTSFHLKSFASNSDVHAPKEVQEFIVPAIDDYYRGKEQVQRDEAMRSCGIAAQTLMLAAKAMGYDSCPMDGFDFEKVAQLINLPDDHVVAMFVAIGKGTKETWPRPGQLALNDVVVIIRSRDDMEKSYRAGDARPIRLIEMKNI